MAQASRKPSSNRRSFLVQVAGAAAATQLGSRTVFSAPPQISPQFLPSIRLGTHSFSRLIAGWNPIGGYSYLGPNMDQHMREYFTEDQTVQFLLRCLENGITAHQYDPSEQMVAVLRRVRETGADMKFICLHSEASRHGSLADVAAKTRPIAFSHHGGVTDKLFREGKAEQVHDYVKAVHDLGLLAGVSAHNPDNIKFIADAGWENDFFMCCFHYVTRLNDHPELEKDVKVFGKAFYKADPEVMSKVIRDVDKPCLGFKILAAGRTGFTRTGVADAFEYAFRNIKPTDGVIVGMYPRFRDEVAENAKLTAELGHLNCLS